MLIIDARQKPFCFSVREILENPWSSIVVRNPPLPEVVKDNKNSRKLFVGRMTRYFSTNRLIPISHGDLLRILFEDTS